MSDNTQAATTGGPTDETGVAELQSRYEKKDKVVCGPTDDQDAFMLFVDGMKGNYADWSEKAPPTFTTFAMVETEGKANRLIAVANEETAFADPAVRKALYRMYVNRVVNTAAKNEASQDMFITPGGCFKQIFDLDAFRFQAKTLAKFLRGQGLSGVTNNSLRLAFSISAFATSQFPRVSAEAWKKIIGIARKSAEAAGYDLSIFDHWLATRDSKSADMSELELDFGELEEAEGETVKGVAQENNATS